MKSNLNLTPDEFRVLCYLKTVRATRSLESIGYAVKAYRNKEAEEFAKANIKTLLDEKLISEKTTDGVLLYEAYLTESEEVKSVLSWDQTRPTNDALEKGTKVSFKPHSLSPAMKRDGIEEQEGYVIDWHFNEEYKRYVNIIPLDDDGKVMRKKIWKRDRALTIIDLPTEETTSLVDESLKRPKRIFNKRKVKIKDEDSTIITYKSNLEIDDDLDELLPKSKTMDFDDFDSLDDLDSLDDFEDLEDVFDMPDMDFED